MNKKITAGPPFELASPIVEKIPAPMIAAIPKAVKSLTFKCLPSDACPSNWACSLAFNISATFFFLNNELSCMFFDLLNKCNNIPFQKCVVLISDYLLNLIKKNMKKIILSLSLLSSVLSFGQFTQANEPAIGDTRTMYLVDSFAPNYATITGANVTWDYTQTPRILNQSKQLNVVNPSTTTQASLFTSATKAIEIPGFTTSYFSSTTTARNSQGFTFIEPTFGNVNAVLSVDNAHLMNYPFAVTNSLVDAVAGTINVSLGTFNCTGTVAAGVDGSGTLKLNAATTLTNVLRYKLVDSLQANTLFGTVSMKRVQYEYYHFATSNLPAFIHTKIDVSINGNLQTLNLVLSSVQHDETLAIENNALAGVSIVPNPATTNVTISNLPVNGQVVITDLNGKIAQSQAISATDSLTISDLKAGVYFVTIATELGSKTEKLIIQ